MEILILGQTDNWEGKNDETEWLREIGNGEFKKSKFGFMGLALS